MTDAIRTVQIVWQSPCKTAHIEERSGMFWCYIGPDHVGTQLHKEAGVKLITRKMEERKGVK